MTRDRPKQTKSGRPSTPEAPAPRLRTGLRPNGRWIVIALIAIYAIGFWARFEDYPAWKNNPGAYFYQDQPILSNGDGYYYLRLARDLTEGTYDATDPLRRYPDSPPRPSPPPLLSALTSALHSIFGFSLDRIAVFLPVLLAPLLIVPLYLIARAAGGGPVMGLSAALIAVVSEYYAGRTRIGVYDTDCLIVTLTFTICYCVYRFARDESVKRYIFAAAAVLGYTLFYLWWDTATMVVSAICLSMLAVALVFFYRPPRREGLMFAAGVAGVVLVALLWRGFDAPLSLARGVFTMLAFVGGGDVAGPFPSTVGNIRELQVLPFAQMSRLVAGHSVLFVIACAGFAWWLVGRGKSALLFAIITLLAVLPMVYGNRFLIFQTPVVALGIGYLVDRLWRTRTHWSPVTMLVPVAVIAPAALCYSQTTANVFRSPMARSMSAIHAVAENTPENATVWSTFWHGYPVLYYARRATITDGGTLEGPRLVYQNIPLASADPRMAANFVQFWVGRGTAGMERLYTAMDDDHAAALLLVRSVCAAGADRARPVIEQAIRGGRLSATNEMASAGDWLRFFFPPRRGPIFLLLTQDLTESTVWFERGTWDPATRRGIAADYRPFFGVRRAEDAIRGNRGLAVNPANGAMQSTAPDGRPNSEGLSRIVTAAGGEPEIVDFGRGGASFEWVPARKFGAAMSDEIAGSLFNRMFIRHQTDRTYFRPVKLETPSFQLWEVRGDALP